MSASSSRIINTLLRSTLWIELKSNNNLLRGTTFSLTEAINCFSSIDFYTNADS